MIRTAWARSSCSAWLRRSAAIQDGVLVAVGDHQDLRGTGDHVDADLAKDLALGFGDVDVAGADDLVDRADARGAKGQRADRLGAADAVDLVDPGERGGDQDQSGQRAVRRRHRHHQPLDAGDRAGTAFISTELG